MFVSADWFYQTKIIQTTINIWNCDPVKIKIKSAQIETTKIVKFLRITLGNKISSEEHVSQLCKNPSVQLNVMFHLQIFIGYEEKRSNYKKFLFSNFKYFQFVKHFCSCNSFNIQTTIK